MSEYHPDRTDLEQFARCEVVAAEGRWIEDHLRSGCAICQRTMDGLLPRLDDLSLSSPYGEATSILAAPTAPIGPTAPGGRSMSVTFLDPLAVPADRAEPAAWRAPWSTFWSVGTSQTPPAPQSPSSPLSLPPSPFSMAAAVPGVESLGTSGTPETLENLENLEDDVAWTKVFAKVGERVALISSERAAAPPLVVELMRHPHAERIELARSSPRFHTLAVCELLIDNSFHEGFRNAALAVELAETALQLVQHLDDRYYGASVVQDLRARAWAYLGNARRINYDLVGAEQALNIAERLVEMGSSDPLEEARILDLRASLLSDQGWLEEAADLLDSVIDIYEDVRDLHRKGRALISKGVFLGHAGWPEEAIELIPEGLSLIDWEQEPRLVLTARHNLIVFLSDSGRCVEALRQLQRFRDCYQEFSEPSIEVRLIWLEGRIAAGLRRFEQAELALREVRRRLLDQSMGYDAALVMLDLANIYLEQGRRDEVRELAEEVLPIFLSQEVHRHAIAALIAFQQAVEGNRATPALVQEIASYLLRARKNPRLCFRQKAA